MTIPRYAPRHFTNLDTWRLSDWRINVYGIAVDARNYRAVLDGQIVEEARAFAAANLNRMDATPHYSVGFAILHHGSAAKLTHCNRLRTPRLGFDRNGWKTNGSLSGGAAPRRTLLTRWPQSSTRWRHPRIGTTGPPGQGGLSSPGNVDHVSRLT